MLLLDEESTIGADRIGINHLAFDDFIVASFSCRPSRYTIGGSSDCCADDTRDMAEIDHDADQ